MNDTYNDEFDKNSTTQRKLIKESRISPEKTVETKTKELDIAQKNLINAYRNEEKIPVRVAPSYARYFGRVMRVAINGIIVAVRCDGSTTSLPKSFAVEVLRRMSEMDKYDLRLNKMAQVQQNLESSPGQLNFFG